LVLLSNTCSGILVCGNLACGFQKMHRTVSPTAAAELRLLLLQVVLVMARPSSRATKSSPTPSAGAAAQQQQQPAMPASLAAVLLLLLLLLLLAVLMARVVVDGCILLGWGMLKPFGRCLAVSWLSVKISD
jgi:hypothetical protein